MCARSWFRLAAHDSRTLSGIGAVCLRQCCFAGQPMPRQRVMSLSMVIHLRKGRDGDDGALWFVGGAVTLGGVNGDDLAVVIEGNAG